MEDTQKYCRYCKFAKDKGYFVRTIQRKNYGPDCDEDGHILQEKHTSMFRS